MQKIIIKIVKRIIHKKKMHKQFLQLKKWYDEIA